MIHKTKNKHHKIALILIALAIIITFYFYPDFYINTLKETDYSLILTILFYLPGFFLLMGLFEVWLPQKLVISHLGKHSGFKGSVYSFVLGSIFPGPLYIAFPFAAILLKKGVSRFNTSLFIGAWACFKIGEEIFELQFLGFKFFILRFVISVPFIVLISYIIEKAHFKEKDFS